MSGAALTPLRRRVLVAIAAGPEGDLQEIGYRFSSNPRGLPIVFRRPQAATRFGCKLAAPLRHAGLIEAARAGGGRRWVRVTERGRVALRQTETLALRDVALFPQSGREATIEEAVTAIRTAARRQCRGQARETPTICGRDGPGKGICPSCPRRAAEWAVPVLTAMLKGARGATTDSPREDPTP